MKIFSNVRNMLSKVPKRLLVATAVVVTAATAVFAYGYANNNTQAAGCPTNDIMPCGASNRTEFVSKLKKNSPSDMDNIYANSRYDLPTSQYDEFASYAKAGKINPDTGNVTVDGKTVMYDAQSLGRNSKGSISSAVNIDGKTYYQSPIRLLTKYTNDAMVLFDSKGNVQTVIMNLCGNPMTGKEKNPTYVCNALNMTQVDRDTFKFSSSIGTTNGATVTKIVYDFGNGVTRTETSPSTTFEYTYPQAGNYTAKVTAYVKTTFGRSEFPITVTANCQKPVTVAEAPAPKVDIVKTVDGVENKEVALNTPFVYNLKVTNTGNVELKDLVVSDTAPTGVQFVGTDKGSIVNNALSYTIPSLAKGASVTVNITAKLTQYIAGNIVNKACVETPTVPGGNPDDCDDATITTPTPKVPHVKIDKVVNGVERDEVAVNETFTYTLKVTNDGEVALVNAVVSDIAPAGVTFLTTDKGSIANNKLTYTVPSLAVGASTDIKITAKVTAYKAGDIVNTACVNAVEVNPGNPNANDDCDDATVTVEVPKVPHVTINKVVNGLETDKVKVGENFVYTLKITNDGQINLVNAVVSDQAPANIQFVSTDKGTIVNNALNYTIPSLAIGQSSEVKITAKVTTYVATSIKNTACVETPTVPGGNPDDCDDATVTVEEPGKVVVCNPATGEIISVPEAEAGNYEPKDSVKCKMVPVCDPATQLVREVKWIDKDKYLPEGSDKCVKMQVCVIADGTGTMVVITKDQFDATKHSIKSADCKDKEVCRLSDKKIVKVKESEFVANSSLYSTTLGDCSVTPPVTPPTPETPHVLPSTGPVEIIGSLFGSSAVGYGIYAYSASRRALKSVR